MTRLIRQVAKFVGQLLCCRGVGLTCFNAIKSKGDAVDANHLGCRHLPKVLVPRTSRSLGMAVVISPAGWWQPVTASSAHAIGDIFGIKTGGRSNHCRSQRFSAVSLDGCVSRTQTILVFQHRTVLLVTAGTLTTCFGTLLSAPKSPPWM